MSELRCTCGAVECSCPCLACNRSRENGGAPRPLYHDPETFWVDAFGCFLGAVLALLMAWAVWGS